jgi:hypothetical protein
MVYTKFLVSFSFELIHIKHCQIHISRLLLADLFLIFSLFLPFSYKRAEALQVLPYQDFICFFEFLVFLRDRSPIFAIF